MVFSGLPILDVQALEEVSSTREGGRDGEGWTISMPPLRISLTGGDKESLSTLKEAVSKVAKERLAGISFPILYNDGAPLGLTASYHDLLRVAEELDITEPPGPDLSKALRDAVPSIPRTPSIKTSKGELRFVDRPLLMGILNITPDSFSDGGLYLEPEAALDKAWQLIEEGADVLDLGAESSRPGSDPIDASEELSRLMPVLSKIAQESHVPLSVDTYKSEVAEVALKEGAEIINDISGLLFDPSLASVVAKYEATVILMHTLGRPKTMQKDPRYRWLVPDILESLEFSFERAIRAGVPRERCLIDPGLGFGKTFAQNEQLIEAIPTFRKTGQPVAVGPSRKAFVGARWGTSEEALTRGTVETCLKAAALGASVLRVHDVAVVRGALEEVTRKGPPVPLK